MTIATELKAITADTSSAVLPGVTAAPAAHDCAAPAVPPGVPFLVT